MEVSMLDVEAVGGWMFKHGAGKCGGLTWHGGLKAVRQNKLSQG